MSNVSVPKEIRDRVSALAKRRKEAECTDREGNPSGHTFDDCLAWCVSVGVKRQDTLDRFAAAKKKERRAAAKEAKPKAKKPSKAKTAKAKAAKKPAAKKPAKANAPKAAGKKRASKKAAEEAPVDKAAE